VSEQQPGSGGEPEQRLPGKAIMPLLSLQRHWVKSVALFVLIAGLGLPVAWIKGTAVYYSEAVIQVNFRYAPNLNTVQEIETHSNTQYDRLVQQQIRTITRFDVVKRALDSLGEQRWAWQLPDETERHAIQRLMGALRIRAVPNTFLVTIGLEDKDPGLIPLLVNPVVESYLQAAKEDTFVGEDIRLGNLYTRRDEFQTHINDLGKQLEQVSKQLGLTTFQQGVQNPYDRILVDMSSALATARQQRVTAEAEIEAMRGKHDGLLRLSLDAEAQKLTASDRALGDLRAYLYQRRAQLVQTMSGLKPNHEGRQAAEREIEQINQEIVQATADKTAEMKAILEERRRADMRAEIAEQEAKLEEARLVEEALALRVEQRSAQLENFMHTYNQGLGIKEELERQRRQLNRVLDRIDEIEIEANAPGYVRLISLATVPEQPMSGGRKKLFILFLVAASGAALILPLALDFLDNRIRTPIDLHRMLGFAPSAWLPEARNAETRLLFNQQMERLAIAVLRDIDAHGARCAFSITATLPGAGKSLVTYQLADYLQRLGVNTVVLSCDPVNRDVDPTAPSNEVGWASSATDDDDQIADVRGPSVPGVVELLQNSARLEDAIIERGADRADWIGFGDHAGATQIANVVRLKQLLRELGQRYDLTLVDGPAILMSANAEAISGICYGTLIVVDAVHTPAKQLKRAVSIIERAEPEVVGSILNRTPIFKRGGYYDHLAKSLAHHHEDKPGATGAES
jgi:succinoglycan biosynthesis transport protein ExoP